MVTWKDPQRFQCEMSRVLKTQSHVKIYTPPNSTSTNQMSPWGISSVLPTIPTFKYNSKTCPTFMKLSDFPYVQNFDLWQFWQFSTKICQFGAWLVGNTEYHRNWLTFRYDADADHIIMPELEQRRMMMGSIWEWPPPYFENHFKHGFLHFSWKWIA